MAKAAAAAVESDVLKQLDEATRDAPRLQLETLRAILDRNAAAGYVRRNLGDDSGDSFRRLVPLSSYDDYADLIQRIADGEEDPSELCVDPLVCFFYSSGTSNMRPKLIPFFDCPASKASSNLSHQAGNALLRRLFPPRQSASKILWFLYAGNVAETKGGFKAMAASAFPFHNKSSKSSPLFSMCVSPQEVILGSDSHQQMYCHLLCGLHLSGSVDAIRAPYAVGLIRAIRLLESKWRQLCEDIELGCVSSEISDTSMRDSVRNLLSEPQPDLAKRVREVCEKDQWSGILKALWPQVRYIACVTTGSMEQYYTMLKHYAGDLPIACGDYFASECSIGINLNRLSPPESTSFVVIPTAAYFEFLPFEPEASTETNETVDITGVGIGKLYEIVATTYRGLYRYRLGDIVKVIGFYNSSPRVEFITRAPKEASEVFTERNLMLGMESVQLMLRKGSMGELVEYAGYLDLDSNQKHLVGFVEVTEGSTILAKMEECMDVLRRCCQLVEDCLGSVYKVKRGSGDLASMEIAVVRPGSFDELTRVALETGAPANQYKPPKIIRNLKLVKFLRECVLLAVHLE